MTTPSTNTPYAILCDALVENGKLQRGDTPDSELIADCMRRMNDMINVEQTQGVKLFLQTDHEITLVAGTVDYVITINSIKPLRATQGYYLDSLNNSRPIYPLSWQEWLTLSNRTQTGPVTQYFIDKQATTLTVYFWLVPDTTAATGTAHLLIEQQVTNPINLTETMAFPAEWRLWLMWNLAAEKSTGQPAAVIARCEQKAAYYKDILESWDVEDASITFQPDQRAGYTRRIK